MLILLRSRWSRLVRLSLMFLFHRLYKPFIVKNGQHFIDCILAVPRAGLDIASQDGLGFFCGLGYAIRHARYSTDSWRKRDQERRVPLLSPLKELARSRPSEVMSRYSMSA